ncbi:MAG: methyltransferase [Betaproteobacteria bacterium]|nr:methyltransferase [Betaproteobacteria bacterium]
MRVRAVLSALATAGAVFAGVAHAATDVSASLDRAIAGDHRSPAHRARDVYRHPRETLLFLGLRPDMTVVEVWPAAGWYTEIIAPVLREAGTFYAARFPVSWDKAPGFLKAADKVLLGKIAERPDVYGDVKTTELLPPMYPDAAPAGSVDLVLTFRNVHNWAKSGSAEAMFKAFFRALKPGGVLGVVDHRAKPGTPFEAQIASGYLTERYVIETAEKAGFRLAAKSEVNANPRDTTDHPAGVWTLPPTFRLGDEDRARYSAIGESDRMTLKFVKP